MRFRRPRNNPGDGDLTRDTPLPVLTCAACMNVIEDDPNGPDVLVLERCATWRGADPGQWLPTLPFYFHARHAPHLNDEWRATTPADL